MARFRRQRRPGLGKRPASAFAPSEDRKGKGIQWESILNIATPQALDVVCPTTVRTVGLFQTRIVTMIPPNVTRGTVTVERIRGNLQVYFNSTELASSLANWFVFASIQLVMVQDGGILSGAALSPGNAADQESNKTMWNRLYYPRAGTTITSPGAVEVHESDHVHLEVDVKVKRRFDRATWALALVLEAETTAMTLHLMGGTLRGLFRSSDGL